MTTGTTTKIFYIFRDPMGAVDSKIGITRNALVRLGSYQISYSIKSHRACFDVAYSGPARAVDLLERAVKRHFDWHIERDGRGASEWVSLDFREIERQIDQLIKGYGFQVYKLPEKFLPLTVENINQWLTSQQHSML